MGAGSGGGVFTLLGSLGSTGRTADHSHIPLAAASTAPAAGLRAACRASPCCTPSEDAKKVRAGVCGSSALPTSAASRNPTRARLRGDLRVPSLRAVPLLPHACKPDGKALALREQNQEEGARVPGRRPGGCRPGKGLMSSARIEMMRRCDRAAGLLNPPPSDYT